MDEEGEEVVVDAAVVVHLVVVELLTAATADLLVLAVEAGVMAALLTCHAEGMSMLRDILSESLLIHL